jgi:putative intracellular protease/amidase
MKVAILLYDRFTALDAVGPYEVLSRLPEADLTFVATKRGPTRADTGRLAIEADATLDEIPSADILVIPGGPGQADLMAPGPVLDWVRAIDAGSTWTTSVCTGSLILGASGLLKDRKAVTHWLAMGQLEKLGAIPTGERVVIDDKYVTAAGVSAGIDMALTLAAKVAGDQFAQGVQLAIEYDPQPPFNAGSPAKAPAEVTDFLRSHSRHTLP